MRGATQCARRLKRVFRSLRTRLGKVSRPSRGDPITQMILGIFSRDLPESKAREALDRLRGMVVDYNELREIWLADPRISRDHTFVYPDKRGFSGKCLPKDCNAIIKSCEQRGYEPKFMKACLAINDQFRKLNKQK